MGDTSQLRGGKFISRSKRCTITSSLAPVGCGSPEASRSVVAGLRKQARSGRVPGCEGDSRDPRSRVAAVRDSALEHHRMQRGYGGGTCGRRRLDSQRHRSENFHDVVGRRSIQGDNT